MVLLNRKGSSLLAVTKWCNCHGSLNAGSYVVLYDANASSESYREVGTQSIIRTDLILADGDLFSYCRTDTIGVKRSVALGI